MLSMSKCACGFMWNIHVCMKYTIKHLIKHIRPKQTSTHDGIIQYNTIHYSMVQYEYDYEDGYAWHYRPIERIGNFNFTIVRIGLRVTIVRIGFRVTYNNNWDNISISNMYTIYNYTFYLK